MLNQNQPLLRFTLLSDLLGPLRLRHDPIGWEDMGVQLHRDPKYHGLTTEWTVELGFIKNGKAYLSQLLDAAGIEADVTLLVEVYDANAFSYEEYYRGRLDLSGQSQTATEFRCQAEKLGFTQKFLNREDSTIDLLGSESVGGQALPAPAPTWVELHSKAIFKRYDVLTPTPAAPALPDYVTDGESRFKVMYFGFGSPAIDEFEVQEVAGGTVTIPAGNTSPEVPVYTTKERGDFTFDLNLLAELRIERQNGQGDFDKVDGEIYFRINDEAPVKLAEWKASQIAGTYRRELRAVLTSYTRRLNIGDKIYFYGRLHVYDISGPIIGPYRFTVYVQMHPGAYFRMQAATQTDPTPGAGLLAYEALNRLAQACTDEPVAFHSDYFGRRDTTPAYFVDGPGSALLVTGGFQLRGFPLEAKSVHATWKGLFEALAAAYWLGCGIESVPGRGQVVRVEDAAYFYSSAVALELPATVRDYVPDSDGTLVSNLTLRELTDRYYITARAGWQKWQAGQANGLDEFNAVREWALPLTVPDATYEAVGNYITAGFYIESVRRQRYDATATTDQGTDNENILICLVRTATGFETERNQLFAELSGVYSPETVYNPRLSPARILRRHGRALAAGLRFEQDKRVRFSFGEGNNEFSSRLISEAAPVVENADLLGRELGEPLWRPQSWSFTAPCTYQQAMQVLANPRGRVRFYDERGGVQEGWVLDFKHTLTKNEAEFTLLRCHNLSS